MISDVRGSIAWEAWNYRKDASESGGEIAFDGHAQVDRIKGHQLQIASADTSRTLPQFIFSPAGFTIWKQHCLQRLPSGAVSRFPANAGWER